RAVYPARSASEGNLPVYFPGTIDASGASAVETRPGVDLNGLDLILSDGRAARIRGQVMDGATGLPALGAAVTLVPRRGNVATGSSQRAAVSNTGIFEFGDVVPGPYDVVATMIGGSGGRLASSAPVEVASSDIDNLRLVLQPQLAITGKVSIENLQAGGP